MREEHRFDELPHKVEKIWQELLNIKSLLLEKTGSTIAESKWLSLEEVIRYDPAQRKKSTWYKMTSNGEVPYRKKGKQLYFLKSEIDEWLNQNKILSDKEIYDKT